MDAALLVVLIDALNNNSKFDSIFGCFALMSAVAYPWLGGTRSQENVLFNARSVLIN